MEGRVAPWEIDSPGLCAGVGALAGIGALLLTPGVQGKVGGGEGGRLGSFFSSSSYGGSAFLWGEEVGLLRAAARGSSEGFSLGLAYMDRKMTAQLPIPPPRSGSSKKHGAIHFHPGGSVHQCQMRHLLSSWKRGRSHQANPSHDQVFLLLGDPS